MMHNTLATSAAAAETLHGQHSFHSSGCYAAKLETCACTVQISKGLLGHALQ